jgi:hypothetical protein
MLKYEIRERNINFKKKTIGKQDIIEIVICEVLHSKSTTSFSLYNLIVLCYTVSRKILFEQKKISRHW